MVEVDRINSVYPSWRVGRKEESQQKQHRQRPNDQDSATDSNDSQKQGEDPHIDEYA